MGLTSNTGLLATVPHKNVIQKPKVRFGYFSLYFFFKVILKYLNLF